MGKLRLGVDIDGVVADFTGEWRRLHQLWFDDLPPESQDWESPLSDSRFNDWDEFWEWADATTLRQTMQPVPGALGGLYELHKDGHRIDFVTSRHPHWQDLTYEWLQRHVGSFLRVDIKHVHFTGTAKFNVPCDLYIEDSPDVIRQLLVKEKRVLKFKQPWNSSVRGVQTAKGWHGSEGVVAKVRNIFAPVLLEESE